MDLINSFKKQSSIPSQLMDLSMFLKNKDANHYLYV
jgi:hypothetical protein